MRGLPWSAASGALFVALNATMRGLALQLDPMQAQFLRYLFGLLVMLPLLLHGPLAEWWPRNPSWAWEPTAAAAATTC